MLRFKQIPRTLASFLLGGLLVALAATPAFAQDATEDAPTQRYTIDFRGMPLAEALQQLAETTGVGLVYDPALVGALTTTCAARN